MPVCIGVTAWNAHQRATPCIVNPIADTVPILIDSDDEDIVWMGKENNVPARSLETTPTNSCVARILPTSAGDDT